MTTSSTLMTVSQVAKTFAVDVKTVTRWADAGKLGPVIRTPGGHRRMDRERVLALAQPETHQETT